MGLKFVYQILKMLVNDDFYEFAYNLVSKFLLKFDKVQSFENL